MTLILDFDLDDDASAYQENEVCRSMHSKVRARLRHTGML